MSGGDILPHPEGKRPIPSPCRLSPAEANQARLTALKIAAWQANNTDQPALSIAHQLETTRAAIDALEWDRIRAELEEGKK